MWFIDCSCVLLFIYKMILYILHSLVPRPLLDFILQLWQKNREKAWDHYYVTDWKWWTRFHNGLLPIFLHSYEIKSGSGLGTRVYLKWYMYLIGKIPLPVKFICSVYGCTCLMISEILPYLGKTNYTCKWSCHVRVNDFIDVDEGIVSQCSTVK